MGKPGSSPGAEPFLHNAVSSAAHCGALLGDAWSAQRLSALRDVSLLWCECQVSWDPRFF